MFYLVCLDLLSATVVEHGPTAEQHAPWQVGQDTCRV